MPPPPPPPPGAGPPMGYPGYPPHQQAAPRNGMGVAALVLGILGLVFVWFPFLGLILAVLGLIFGFVGLSRANKGQATNKGMAIAGIVMGVIGVIVGLIWIIFIGNVLNKAENCSEKPTQQEVLDCLQREFDG